MGWTTMNNFEEKIKEEMYEFWAQNAPKDPRVGDSFWHGSMTVRNHDSALQCPIEGYDQEGFLETVGFAYLTQEGEYSEYIF